MGIDIYVRWNGQTREEQEAQYTGFSVVDGHVGYLREAYHGEPYATRYLVAEAFAAGKASIPATILRERLPHTLKLAREREQNIYHETDEYEIFLVLQSFVAFLELSQSKAKEVGWAVIIIASYEESREQRKRGDYHVLPQD